jgi:hypothetical protein
MQTVDEVRKTIFYCSLSGVVVSRRTGKVLIGCQINIGGAKLVATDCIWAYHYGVWPPQGKIVDHKDRVRTNRKIANLRLATYSQNGFNAVARNEFSKGVTFDAKRPSKPWRAQMRIEGRKTNLGRFATEKEAAEAYRQAALMHQGEFACLD